MKEDAAPILEDNLQRSRNIIAWLDLHPLIKLNALCTEVGYDTHSLYKVMRGTGSYTKIPAKLLDAIEKILKEYGYEKS